MQTLLVASCFLLLAVTLVIVVEAREQAASTLRRIERQVRLKARVR